MCTGTCRRPDWTHRCDEPDAAAEESYGGYAAPLTPEERTAVVASQEAAMEWYTGPPQCTAAAK